MHTYVRTYIHACIHTYIHTYSFAEVHSATWNLPCAVKRLKVRPRSCACMHACVRVCVRACVRACAHIHAFTHTARRRLPCALDKLVKSQVAGWLGGWVWMHVYACGSVCVYGWICPAYTRKSIRCAHMRAHARTNARARARAGTQTRMHIQDNVRHNKYEVQKFQREAYLLRSLLHPGVLRVFGFCKIDHLLVTEVRAVCMHIHICTYHTCMHKAYTYTYVCIIPICTSSPRCVPCASLFCDHIS